MRGLWLIFGLVTAAVAGLPGNAAHAQEQLECGIPGTSTRIRPADIKPQIHSGVISERNGSIDFSFDVPAGAHLEIEVVARWTITGREQDLGRFESFDLALADPLGLKWDIARDGGLLNPHFAVSSRSLNRAKSEVTDRRTWILSKIAARNLSVPVRLTSAPPDLAYIIRARARFFGDRSGRLDAGGEAGSSLPIVAGQLIEGNSSTWTAQPPTIVNPRSNEIDINELNNELNKEPADQSVPPPDRDFLNDGVDLYRVPGVVRGSTIKARLVGVEALRTGLPVRPANYPLRTSIEILQPACDADGNFILIETPSAEGFSSFGASEDEFIATRTGDYFVQVKPGFLTKYWFQVDFEETPSDFIVGGPEFHLSTIHAPEEPIIGAPLHVGFRLWNVPDYWLDDVQIAFEFADAGSDNAITAVESRQGPCKRAEGAAVFNCMLGTMATGSHRDFLFRIDALPAAGVRWRALWTWDSEIGEPQLVTGTVGADLGPAIDQVLTLADQGNASFGIPSYPYPFNPSGREGLDFRTLFVTGWGLPQATGDDVELAGPDGSIEYRFIGFPEGATGFVREQYESGWAAYRRANGLAADDPLPEGLEGFLVRANLRQGIMPGVKEIELNGVKGDWELFFGGLDAELFFVHEKDIAPLENAYVPQRLEIRLQPNVNLPVEEIPLILFEDRRPGRASRKIIARRDDLSTARIKPYVTPPILLLDTTVAPLPQPQPGDVVIPVLLRGPGPVRLRAEIDENFRVESFALPVIPTIAKVDLLNDPLEEPFAAELAKAATPGAPRTLFHRALDVAAGCRSISVTNWDSLKLQNQTADEFWNVVLLEFFDEDVREVPVTVGHHAATLLLREMFIDRLGKAIAELDKIVKDDAAIVGVLRRMEGTISAGDVPISRIEITAPDETEVAYGSAVTTGDLAFIAEQYNLGSGPDGIAKAGKWRFDATREALTKLRENTQEILDDAREIEACEVQDLVRLTGSGFDFINQAVEPKLRRLRNASGAPVLSKPGALWDFDDAGRLWMGDLARLSAAVKRQEARAQQDNLQLLALAAVLTVPVAAGSSGVAAGVYIALGMGVVDLVGTAALEINDYLEKQAEVDFSEDAAIVLGYARNEQALAEARHWIEISFNIGLALPFVATDAAILAKTLSNPRVIGRGMWATRALRERPLKALTPAQRRNFAAFAVRSRMRKLELGEGAITQLEREALAEIDRIIAARANTATTNFPTPDLPNPATTGLPAPDLPNPATTGLPAPDLPNPATSVLPKFEPPQENVMSLVIDIESGQLLLSKVEQRAASSSSDYSPLFGSSASSAGGGAEGAARGSSDIFGPDASYIQLSSSSGSPPAIPKTIPSGPDLKPRVFAPGMRNRSLAFTNLRNETVVIELGEFRGSGSFSSAFDDITVPTKVERRFGGRVVKVTFTEAVGDSGTAGARYSTQLDFQVDEAGRNLLLKFGEFNPRIRVTRRAPGDVHRVVGERVPGVFTARRRVAVVQLVEDVGESAFDVAFRKAPGRPNPIGGLTDVQADSYFDAMKAANDEGIVILDNKLDNIVFEALPPEVRALAGPRGGKPRVVVIDTGGVVEMKGATRQIRAERARQLQRIINGPWNAQLQDVLNRNGDLLFGLSVEQRRAAARKIFALDQFENFVELKDHGVARMVDIPFNPSTADQPLLANVAERFKAYGKPLPPVEDVQ